MPHYPTLTQNYAAPPFNAIKGEGVTLYDDSGNSYLDFTTGIAVTALGPVSYTHLTLPTSNSV